MRSLAICLTLLAAIVPLAALAQQEQTPQRVTVRTPPDYRGLDADDMKSYCFWAGQLYSIGAAFCSRQQTLSTCTTASGGRPVWVNKDNDKLCDRNPSLTPQ